MAAALALAAALSACGDDDDEDGDPAASDAVREEVDTALTLSRQALTSGDDSAFWSPEFEDAGVRVDEYMLDQCGYDQVEVTGTDFEFEGLPESLDGGPVAIRAGTMTHDYKRHGTTTLFAALNVLTGTVIGRMICDNYGTHKHANVKKWLAKTPAVSPALDPHLSSWLNLKPFVWTATAEQILAKVARGRVALQRV